MATAQPSATKAVNAKRAIPEAFPNSDSARRYPRAFLHVTSRRKAIIQREKSGRRRKICLI